jgi:hypothetical protein
VPSETGEARRTRRPHGSARAHPPAGHRVAPAPHVAPPADEGGGVGPIVPGPSEVARAIRHSSPEVLVLAAVALLVLLLVPGFLASLVRPRSGRPRE